MSITAVPGVLDASQLVGLAKPIAAPDVRGAPPKIIQVKLEAAATRWIVGLVVLREIPPFVPALTATAFARKLVAWFRQAREDVLRAKLCAERDA